MADNGANLDNDANEGNRATPHPEGDRVLILGNFRDHLICRRQSLWTTWVPREELEVVPVPGLAT